MDRDAVIQSLITLYEESRSIDTVQGEFGVLSLLDDVAEKFGVQQEFLNRLDEMEE